MALTENFAAKNFVEQVSLLSKISKERDMGSLSELFALYNQPIGDKPVDAMVEHTLRDLLNENESQVVTTLREGTVKDKKLCLQIARVKKFSRVVPELMWLVKTDQDPEVIRAALLAMGELGDPQFLEIFRSNLNHEDELLASISIEMVGVLKDHASLPQLQRIIHAGERLNQYQECRLEVAKAIGAVGALGSGEAISFLVGKLHHRNPTARRLVHEELTRLGEVVVPRLEAVFSEPDIDRNIMAANVLGRIACRSAANSLVLALEGENAGNPNVRFAIFEALGFISSSRGLIALIDGLSETDELILRAVVTSLERLYNPHVGKQVANIVAANELQGQQVLRTIVQVKAIELFTILYESGQALAEKLLTLIQESNDMEILVTFAEKIKSLTCPWAEADAKRIEMLKPSVKKGPRILAVDDSVSILSYYRSVCAGMMLEVVTAENGGEAWDILSASAANSFNLVLVDMNMPVMDGIELTQKIRGSQQWAKIPIIMATTESDKSQVRLAKQRGVDEFVIKPMTTALLEKKIKKMLE